MSSSPDVPATATAGYNGSCFGTTAHMGAGHQSYGFPSLRASFWIALNIIKFGEPEGKLFGTTKSNIL